MSLDFYRKKKYNLYKIALKANLEDTDNSIIEVDVISETKFKGLILSEVTIFGAML